ncbi:MAG: type II secretion system F family protein [Candidatus Diapherotrites archaeon]|nr:type II secretion system F family protein [Candidatus Diapherotrites archaeon]
MKFVSDLIFGKDTLRVLSKDLSRTVGETDIYHFFNLSYIASLFLIFLAFAIVDLFGTNVSMKAILLFFSLVSPPMLVFFIARLVCARRVNQIELFLPDALYQMSSFPTGSPIESSLLSVSSSGYPWLSEEFALTLKQINAGSPVPEAFESLWRRCNSPLVRRACVLLSQGYSTGFDMSNALREVADDIYEVRSLYRESQASLAIEKYTLILAGAFFVPAILGILLGMVSSLDFSGLVDIGFGMESAVKKEVLENAVFGTHVYLALYSIIASFFLGLQEGDIRKGVLYSALILPCALFVFLFFSGLIF